MQRTDSCVFSLVTAFTSGLDVFKKFRGRKHKKKSKRAQAHAAASSEKTGEELRLSKSLRRGTADIQGEYEKHYRGYGERFAVGDPIAQASLCETLLKFNSGLVDIISSFLRSSRKDVHLDYQSLISLSDTSRNEALNTLSRLSQRLSRSNLTLIPHPSHSTPYGKGPHDGKSLSKAASTDQLNKKKAAKGPTSVPAKPGADKAQHIRKMQLYNASAPQLVMVKPRRPHAHRAGSASSAGPPASPPPSYKSSPPQSPPPVSPTAFWRPPPPPLQQQQAAPLAYPAAYGLPPPQYSAPAATPPPIPRKPAAYRSAKVGAPEPPPADATLRRRAPKMTPSLYTFASDSTKLGEIPMDRWNVPFDWGAAERGNREAALGVAPPAPAPERRGLLRGLLAWKKG